ncbi:ABC transporter ATP-binding protein [Chloroflexi bacterium CFX5]|nr:ABC transporter ATP-binding protein [Chloroflexota bacterium]MDL1920721.1 ABC transporter ATP-binding protein [Chloroflexi bacterium CFX5]NUQ60062.1 ABC transporter ATP-binding protein [Anaerolineales bacterium]
MMKMMKFVKPYRWTLALAVALIFAQANLDLALPDYLSRIVNTGIQQGGVENALPEAIRASEMDKVAIFLSAADKEDVLASYALVTDSSPDYDSYLKRYPALETQPIYVLNDIPQSEVDRLNPIMAKALLTVSGIEQAMNDPATAAEMGFDPSKLPPGMSVFDMLAKLPASQLEQLILPVDERFSAMGESMIAQAGVSVVKSEYEALGMDTEARQNNYILASGAWMLLLTLLSGASTIIVGFLSAKIAAGMARDIRRSLFQHVESFSSAEFDKFSTASLITRTTNDVTQIQMVSMIMIRMMFYAPLMGVGGIIKVIAKDSPLAWIIGVAVLMLVSLIAVVFSLALPRFKIIQQLTDRINLVARENLTGMMVVRAFTMEGFEEERFDAANKDLTAVSLFINRVMVTMMPLMMLIMNVMLLSVIWFGANEVAASNMQVGDMMAFMQYSMQIVMAFLMLSMMFIMIPRASVSADRIHEALTTEPHIRDPKEAKKFPEPFRGEIEFRNVSFRYPGGDIDAVQNISFVAKPGQTTAFIGSTGSGKSTIVNLIPRFYEVSDGSIFIDGVDIRDVTQHDLREKIGYVPQKSALFSGTIESNLLYADKNATSEMLQSAIEIAQAKEFVNEKPEGMATEIAQGGANVSGGQKQRLSIARAIVKKPPIYILDDSFSALDFKTDAALRRAFKEKSKDSALLIVTQRVSTIKNAEQIIVLDDGKIVGKGTHNELMETCDTYKEIALSQLNMEELS